MKTRVIEVLILLVNTIIYEIKFGCSKKGGFVITETVLLFMNISLKLVKVQKYKSKIFSLSLSSH